MSKSGINLQDSFLNQVRKDNAGVELVLLDGSHLNGQVRGFDNFTVIMQCGADQHLIYKHAIGQIVHRRGALRHPDPPQHAGGQEQHQHDHPSDRPREQQPQRDQHAPRDQHPPREQQQPPREARPPRPDMPTRHDNGQRPDQAPRMEHAPRQEQAPRPDRGPRPEPAQRHEKPKFNTIDLTDVKID